MVLQNNIDNQEISEVSSPKKASSPKNDSSPKYDPENENKMIENRNFKEIRKSNMKYMKVSL